MQYDLSRNDRYFLNQVIPKWETGQPFDLNEDMKYVFQRELGSKYNADTFQQTLESVRAFLSDHGFAKESPARKYTFSLLSKGKTLRVKGTIEQFEDHMEQERQAGKAIPIVATDGSAPFNKPITPVQPVKSKRGRNVVFIVLFLIVALIVIWLLSMS